MRVNRQLQRMDSLQVLCGHLNERPDQTLTRLSYSPLEQGTCSCYLKKLLWDIGFSLVRYLWDTWLSIEIASLFQI